MDAQIGEAALVHGLCLITTDEDLHNAVKNFYGESIFRSDLQ
jgi:predicted nuclease of predicted toxin-antitoxin system